MVDALRQFARYEITAEELLDKGAFLELISEEPEVVYQITLDDLLAVVEKLEREQISGEGFVREWISGLYEDGIGEALGIDEAMGLEEEIDLLEEQDIPENPLPRIEEEVFRYVFNLLVMPEMLAGREEPAAELIEADFIRELVACYRENQRRPLPEWEYPDIIKSNYIMYIDTVLAKTEPCEEDELQLFARYVQELADKGDETARDVLGYQYYGGSAVFPCDWEKARDIFEQLFQETGSADYANTLGYIYYYGRCNDGEPEDEKAFRFFSFGSAAGITESTYKLADMIRQGRAVPENTKLAEEIIQRLYNEEKLVFEAGEYDCKFADVAFRMGSIYEDRLPGKEDPEARQSALGEVYAFYLEAELAIQKRMDSIDYIGDKAVAARIHESLSRVREEMEFREGNLIARETPWMAMLAAWQHECVRMCFDMDDEVSYVSVRRMGEVEKFLLVLPSYDYCALVEEITLVARGAEEWAEVKPERDYLITDVVEVEPGRFAFFAGDEVVADIKCDRWEYQIERV